jgi:predicted amidohydrolase YtcJ
VVRSHDLQVRIANAIAAAKKNHPNSQVRHHPSHVIQIDPQDFGRFKELDVVAELSPMMIMTPNLVKQLTGLVGKNTLENGMWRAREIIDAGDTLAFASDWTVSDLDPWKAMEYLVSRENEKFPEMGKVAPSSAVTVAEAIRAYTYGGAYAMGKEDKFGTIESGKSADLVVLDRNLLVVYQRVLF